MNYQDSNTAKTNLDAETWVDRYGDYSCRFAIARVRNPSVAEDLVQETFLAALGSLKKFESRSSPQTWLTAILKQSIRERLDGSEQP